MLLIECAEKKWLNEWVKDENNLNMLLRFINEEILVMANIYNQDQYGGKFKFSAEIKKTSEIGFSCFEFNCSTKITKDKIIVIYISDENDNNKKIFFPTISKNSLSSNNLQVRTEYNFIKAHLSNSIEYINDDIKKSLDTITNLDGFKDESIVFVQRSNDSLKPVNLCDILSGFWPFLNPTDNFSKKYFEGMIKMYECVLQKLEKIIIDYNSQNIIPTFQLKLKKALSAYVSIMKEQENIQVNSNPQQIQVNNTIQQAKDSYTWAKYLGFFFLGIGFGILIVYFAKFQKDKNNKNENNSNLPTDNEENNDKENLKP